MDVDRAPDDVAMEEESYTRSGHSFRKGPPPQDPAPNLEEPQGHTFRRGGPVVEERPALRWQQVAVAMGVPLTGRTTIDPRLARLCPACFGPRATGTPLAEYVWTLNPRHELTAPSGADFHIAADGNFMQRHNTSAGDCPPFDYEPVNVLATPFVNAMGEDLDDARKRPPRRYTGEVPEEVVKHCEDSHTAADGSKAKAAGDNHDDKGLMAILCRHDIPLWVCNIDTPGEQMKYFFALIVWASLHLPDNATFAGFYDVGCVAARVAALVSMSGPVNPLLMRCSAAPCQYDILPNDLADRIMFITPAMHAYAHQWACQIVFNPRLKKGAGLTDGEGVERLWSRLRFLINTTRHCAVRHPHRPPWRSLPTLTTYTSDVDDCS